MRSQCCVPSSFVPRHMPRRSGMPGLSGDVQPDSAGGANARPPHSSPRRGVLARGGSGAATAAIAASGIMLLRRQPDRRDP
eukprot:6505531-Prymnesium_polylepis.1